MAADYAGSGDSAMVRGFDVGLVLIKGVITI